MKKKHVFAFESFNPLLNSLEIKYILIHAEKKHTIDLLNAINIYLKKTGQGISIQNSAIMNFNYTSKNPAMKRACKVLSDFQKLIYSNDKKFNKTKKLPL